MARSESECAAALAWNLTESVRLRTNSTVQPLPVIEYSPYITDLFVLQGDAHQPWHVDDDLGMTHAPFMSDDPTHGL